jgi:hypothetical protein
MNALPLAETGSLLAWTWTREQVPENRHKLRADENVQPKQNNSQSEKVITPATFVEAVSAACSSLTRPQYGMDFGGHGGVYVPSGIYQQLLQGQQQQQPADPPKTGAC